MKEVLAYIVVIGPPLVLLAYALSRAASIGYFKTKREHFEKIWRRTQEEDHNGH